MSYRVVEYHGYFYIKGEENDPSPPTIGPYRYQPEAQRIADEYNANQAKQSRNHGRISERASLSDGRL